MTAPQGVVCVFARPPVPGKTKTRLAATVGADRAAVLARAFLRDTIEGIDIDAQVLIATPDPSADFGVPNARIDHGDGDLGERLQRVFTEQLTRAPWVIALGADSPGMPPERLHSAVRSLQAGHATLGPADDGGFYLLGLVRCPTGLLARLPWSTAQTAHRTWERLAQHGLRPHRLGPWFDIDGEADLERFRQEVPTHRAPHTSALLAGMLRGPKEA